MNEDKIKIDRKAHCAYRQLTRCLADRIRIGVYLPGDRLPSVEELNRQTGLHRNTIMMTFKELRDLGLVKYQPAVGCVIRADSPFRVALILPADYEYPADVLKGLIEALPPSGEVVPGFYPDAAGLREYLKKISEENFSGAVIYPDHASDEAVRQFKESGLPLVILENFHRPPGSGCYVDSGVYEAAMLATGDLLDRRCDPVGVIVPNGPFGWTCEEGYKEAHRKRRASFCLHHIKRTGPGSSACEATKDLLSLRSIVYASPADASNGYRILKASGKENIQVVSFGEFPNMDLLVPPVSAVSRDYHRIGLDAGKMLLEQRRLGRRDRPALRVETHRPNLILRGDR